MNCPDCLGTEFEDGLFELPLMAGGRLVLLRNVPAQRCTQCGELILGPESAIRQELALDRGIPDDTIAVDVYDLAKVENAPSLEEYLAEGRLRKAG